MSHRQHDPINEEGVITLDHYGEEDGYYIFYKGSTTPSNVRSVVLLTHGYGAINPAIFGAWISHLIEQQNVVVYPRYQKNLISPAVTKFTDNVVTAWQQAVDELDSLGFRDYPVVFTGHSFGGVIISNMVAGPHQDQIRLPDAVLVAEGGTGPFKSALLESYEGAPGDIPFLIVVGENDWTVGSVFGNKLFRELPDEAEHFFVFQRGARLADGSQITASHYEPYSIDLWCDNGVHNLTFARANRVGKLDIMNYHGYWYWLDLLISQANDDYRGPLDKEVLKASMKKEIGSLADSVLLLATKQELAEH